MFERGDNSKAMEKTGIAGSMYFIRLLNRTKILLFLITLVIKLNQLEY